MSVFLNTHKLGTAVLVFIQFSAFYCSHSVFNLNIKKKKAKYVVPNIVENRSLEAYGTKFVEIKQALAK